VLPIETTTGLPAATARRTWRAIVSDATAEPPPVSRRSRIARMSGSRTASASAWAVSSAAMSRPTPPSPRRIVPTPRTKATVAAAAPSGVGVAERR
jgi:hypothetical protein